jgi:hypothetical protein
MQTWALHSLASCQWALPYAACTALPVRVRLCMCRHRTRVLPRLAQLDTRLASFAADVEAAKVNWRLGASGWRLG